MSVPQDTRELLEGKQWYHQGFDATPLFLTVISTAEMRPDSRRPAGTQAERRVCFFQNGTANWYFDVAEIDRGASAIVDRARTHPHFSTELLHAWKDDEKRFEKFCLKAINHFDLPTLSTPELIALWKKFCQLGTKRFSSSAVIDYFALGTDRLLQDMIREAVGETSRESEFVELFTQLTAPVYRSFITQAECDLLQIAAGTSDETLQDYAARYFWTRNNYVQSRQLSAEDFAEDIRVWKSSANDLVERFVHLLSMPERSRRRKTELMDQYNFSPHLRTLIKISEDFTWWQDERKKATFLNVHVGSELLAEVARRVGIDSELLKYAVAPEITALLTGAGPSTDELVGRQRGCVFVLTPEQTMILRGDEYCSEIRALIQPEPSTDQLVDIRGLTASTGKVRGTAKILQSATQLDKVETGDVLVAVMTRPDYVPAMKRAAAIVTDEGGITSHAAIVSRELGIPCIIGTKVATSVFSDGDTLEVNANHGWVRKIAK